MKTFQSTQCFSLFEVFETDHALRVITLVDVRLFEFLLWQIFELTLLEDTRLLVFLHFKPLTVEEILDVRLSLYFHPVELLLMNFVRDVMIRPVDFFEFATTVDTLDSALSLLVLFLLFFLIVILTLRTLFLFIELTDLDVVRNQFVRVLIIAMRTLGHHVFAKETDVLLVLRDRDHPGAILAEDCFFE